MSNQADKRTCSKQTRQVDERHVDKTKNWGLTFLSLFKITHYSWRWTWPFYKHWEEKRLLCFYLDSVWFIAVAQSQVALTSTILYLTATAFKSECIKIIQPWNIVKATNGIEWVNKQKNDIKGIQKRMPTWTVPGKVNVIHQVLRGSTGSHSTLTWLGGSQFSQGQIPTYGCCSSL